MPVQDELEVQIQGYFEKLEFICQGYTFATNLELEALTKEYNDFAGKIKSLHSLYPDKKIRDTPGDQLLAFITSINSFFIDTNSNFIKKLFSTLELLENNLFSVLTNSTVQKDILRLLESISLPEFDFNFVRFFYSQIIHRWLDNEEYYFDIFLTDIEKINDILPLLKGLFSQDIINPIRIGHIKQISPTVNSLADEFEKKILIIPVSLSERYKGFLIDYLTLIHTYSDVIILQFDLETLYTELLNKDLLFSNNFSQACQSQIEIIRSIKKKIDQNFDFFKKYNIDETVYNTKVQQLEQMIFSHNNIMDHLHSLDTKSGNTIDSLLTEELDFVELLKNNFSFFVPEIKKIFVSYIDLILYLLDWWNNTKKSLLQQSQLYQLMFESFPQDEKIQQLKEIKIKYFKQLFSRKKRFFSFIEEVTSDLLPIFDHFTLIHKSIFNALDDFSKWGSLEKSDPTTNARAIIDAIIQFFTRWKEESLQKAFESKLNLYNSDFQSFYDQFSTIYSHFTEMSDLRFSKPDKAMLKIGIILEMLENSQENIYKLFSTNLEIIESITKITNDIITIKILMTYYDKLNAELLKELSQSWESTRFQPFIKLMKEHLEDFPASIQSRSNREKLKVLTLYNFLINLIQIDEYFNDSILGTIENIDLFSEITKSLIQSKPVLLNLKSLLPDNKKDSVGYFNRNLEQFYDSISGNWIRLGKKIKIFIQTQSKRISLADRKTLVGQLNEYTGTTLNFSFKWPVFENHFKKFDKDFYPVFKRYFLDLMLLEDHWQQTINVIGSSKDVASIKSSLSKETEKFIANTNLEKFSDQFFHTTTNLLEKRLELIKFSPNDSMSPDKMKQLIL